MFKVIVAGSRDFTNFELLKSKLDNILINYKDQVEIVSGCARGADRLGEQYAISNNIPIKKFKAEWDLHGKKAGYLRNQEMIEYADAAVVFWDGMSKG